MEAQRPGFNQDVRYSFATDNGWGDNGPGCRGRIHMIVRNLVEKSLQWLSSQSKVALCSQGRVAQQREDCHRFSERCGSQLIGSLEP
jgi:hypothetical protein